MTLLEGLVPHLKGLHVGFIAIWVAGLVALPRMLARHDRAILQVEFAQIRRATHFGYIWIITPVAILAIFTGSTLIFAREVFTAWIFAKLILVTGLVAIHAWVGHTIIAVAETEGTHEPPEPLVPTILTLSLVVGVLCLALAKPDLGDLPIPSWLLQPLGRHLPFDTPRP